MLISSIFGGRRQCLQGPFWYALELVSVMHQKGPALGGIENVIAESGGQGSELFAGFIEGLLGSSVQTHSSMAHRQQLGIKDPGLGGVQRMTGVLLKTFQCLMDDLALPSAIAETHDIGLLRCMGFAQLRAVADAVEMAHHPPAPAQAFPKQVKGCHHLIPAQRCVVRQALLKSGFQRAQLIFQFLDQGWDMCFYLGCIDGLEAR